MEEEELDDFLPPVSTNTFALPNDPELRSVFEVYKPSAATRGLLSERGRTIFAEAFIENERLGTLKDLCTRALAKLDSHCIAPDVKDDPLKLRMHYDSIDVNIPLKDCYFIDDMHFWRRVVLANVKDATLLMKNEKQYDWKSHGVSLKYVQIVENCPAEFWPEEEMSQLALLVKNYVRSLTIKKLQSLKERAFEQYFESENDSDYSDLSESVHISSDELSSQVEEEEELEEDELVMTKVLTKTKSNTKLRSKSSVVTKTTVEDTNSAEEIVEEELDDAQDSIAENEILLKNEKFQLEQLRYERRRARHARNTERQELREEKEKSKAARAERNLNRKLKKKQELVPTEQLKKVKRKKKKIKDVFNIQVEPEPDDEEAEIPDKRNKEKFLKRRLRYNYLPEHCHHIDLGFVHLFDRLESFSLEFHGPDMSRNYHTRHLNFSYDDMTRLAKGLRSLPNLKIFRLRNSRMDARKLQILARALKYIDTLEVVDFGYDNLQDDCGVSLAGLFDFSEHLRCLELEYNQLGPNVIEQLSFALQREGSSALCYLGLAHNPITDRGLEMLTSSIIGTRSVEALNIKCIDCSDDTILRCIAYRLIREHKPLKSLDISNIPLTIVTSRELVKALQTNTQILHFDCRGCGFDEDAEYEANMLIRRNKFVAKNPYIGHPEFTEEEINDFIKKRRHPIIEKVLKGFEEHKECVNDRVDRTPSSVSVEGEEEETLDEKFNRLYGKSAFTTPLLQTTITSAPLPTPTPALAPPTPQETVVFEDEVSTGSKHSDVEEPFNYDPNTFNKEEFREYVYQPGPSNRYYYFKKNKEPW